MSVAALRSANAPVSRILDEIAKCDLVCANCHRIRTFTRADGNYAKSKSGRKLSQPSRAATSA